MNKQEQIIKWIEEDAADIGAVVTIERSMYGSAFINVETDDALMFVTVGPRGGYKFFYSREPLGTGDSRQRGIRQWLVWDFFKTVKRQRDLINQEAAEEADPIKQLDTADEKPVRLKAEASLRRTFYTYRGFNIKSQYAGYNANPYGEFTGYLKHPETGEVIKKVTGNQLKKHVVADIDRFWANYKAVA